MYGRWLCAWAVVTAAALAGGCAGGAWLESPLQAELPITPPKNVYPTALSTTSVPAPATPATPTAATVHTAEQVPAASASQPSTPQWQTETALARQPLPQRPDHTQPLKPVLAVVPPQYVHAPASTQAAAAPPVANQRSASNAPAVSSAASLPQLDLSILDALAAAPISRPLAASVTSVAIAPSPGESTSQNSVKLAAHEASDSGAAHESLERAHVALIEALETEIRRRRDTNGSDEELPRLEQQLRLVYAAAGRMDDAVAAVESLDAAQQDAYKNLMFGLGVWLSPEEARRAALRTAKVLHSLRDATTDLAGGSKLEVKNLAFCERVEHFGWYTEFPRKEFQPKQQVILYAEVENFAAESKGPAGYETELQGSYVILDASGQEVASRQLQLDKEVCRNYRRDYFLAYRIYLPDGISPGHYRLELTVEDLKARGKYPGRKLGEGVIEFTIR